MKSVRTNRPDASSNKTGETPTAWSSRIDCGAGKIRLILKNRISLVVDDRFAVRDPTNGFLAVAGSGFAFNFLTKT